MARTTCAEVPMTNLPENLSQKHLSKDPSFSNGPHTIDASEWIDTAPFGRLLHMEIVETHDGTAVLSMPFLFDFAQGSGLMHGGALVSLADTAAVMAIKSLVPPGTHFATVSLKTTFLFPVKFGIVTAKARVTSRRKNHLYALVTVFNQEDRSVLEFRACFKIGKKRRAKEAASPN
jgi:uncharacterized protein (TIGR00369 family)